MRILVLSGGGVKGAFQVGVLKSRMMSMSVPYDAIFGVSTGALTGAVIAQGSTHEEQYRYLQQVEKLYLDITGNDSIVKQSRTKLGKLWDLLQHGGLMNPEPLVKLVHKYVNKDRLERSTTYFGAGYVDLQDGEYHLGTDHEAILASAYQPMFFQLRGPRADGGLRMMTPLGDAIDYYKAHRDDTPLQIDVILCNPLSYLPFKSIDHKNPLEVLARTFEIIMHEMFVKDIKYAVRRNKNRHPTDISVDVSVFYPPFHLGNGLEFNPGQIRQMISEGEQAGRAPLDTAEILSIMGDGTQ